MKIIGNADIQEQISIAVESARSRNRAIPHILFAGAAGCGKTTMAKEIAKLREVQFITLLPDHLKKMKDLTDIFESLDATNYSSLGDQEGEVKPAIIFIDEIHNLKIQIQEWLGVAMENFEIEQEDGSKMWIPDFTVVGATTNDGLLSKPFLDRFKMRFIFQPYPFKESVEIVKVHAERMNLQITEHAAEAIAKRGRGVPRILVGYLERVRDMAVVENEPALTEAIVEKTFKLLGVDEKGLRETEIRMLKALYKIGEPVGVENLSILINEVPKTITGAIEPYLIQLGFVVRTGQGRRLTKLGKEYIEANEYGEKKAKRKPLPPGYVRKRYVPER